MVTDWNARFSAWRQGVLILVNFPIPEGDTRTLRKLAITGNRNGVVAHVLLEQSFEFSLPFGWNVVALIEVIEPVINLAICLKVDTHMAPRLLAPLVSFVAKEDHQILVEGTPGALKFRLVASKWAKGRVRMHCVCIVAVQLLQHEAILLHFLIGHARLGRSHCGYEPTYADK